MPLAPLFTSRSSLLFPLLSLLAVFLGLSLSLWAFGEEPNEDNIPYYFLVKERPITLLESQLTIPPYLDFPEKNKVQQAVLKFYTGEKSDKWDFRATQIMLENFTERLKDFVHLMREEGESSFVSKDYYYEGLNKSLQTIVKKIQEINNVISLGKIINQQLYHNIRSAQSSPYTYVRGDNFIIFPNISFTLEEFFPPDYHLADLDIKAKDVPPKFSFNYALPVEVLPRLDIYAINKPTAADINFREAISIYTRHHNKMAKNNVKDYLSSDILPMDLTIVDELLFNLLPKGVFSYRKSGAYEAHKDLSPEEKKFYPESVRRKLLKSLYQKRKTLRRINPRLYEFNKNEIDRLIWDVEHHPITEVENCANRLISFDGMTDYVFGQRAKQYFLNTANQQRLISYLIQQGQEYKRLAKELNTSTKLFTKWQKAVLQLIKNFSWDDGTPEIITTLRSPSAQKDLANIIRALKPQAFDPARKVSVICGKNLTR